jgi:hypothetical protein
MFSQGGGNFGSMPEIHWQAVNGLSVQYGKNAFLGGHSLVISPLMADALA